MLLQVLYRALILLLFIGMDKDDIHAAYAAVSSKGQHHLKPGLPHTLRGFAPNKPLSLIQAIQLAHQHHPEIKALDAAMEAATHRIAQAKGLQLPTIEFRAAAGKEYIREKFSRNKLNPVLVEGSVNETRSEPSLSVRQPLFDGFESHYQLEKARRETIQAQLKTYESKELMAFKASEHYIAVRRFGRLLKLAKMNLTAHKEILAKIQQLIEAGKASSVDKETAIARTEDAEAAVRDIEGDYQTSVAHFIDIIGVEPVNLTSTEIPADLLPKSLEEGLKLAENHNRSLMLAHATKEVAQSDVGVATSPLFPKVGIEVDATKRHHAGGKPGSEENVTAMVVMRFNLYNGGRDLARTQELRARVKQAHYAMLREKRNTEREVRISIAERSSALRQALALRDAVKAKKEVVNSYKEQFQAGKRSHLDILDAQHEYFLSQGSKITAEATLDLANIRYLASMGLLTKILIEKGGTLRAKTKHPMKINKKKGPKKGSLTS